MSKLITTSITTLSIAFALTVPAFAQNAVHFSISDQALPNTSQQQPHHQQVDDSREQKHQWFLTDPENVDAPNQAVDRQFPNIGEHRKNGAASIGVQENSGRPGLQEKTTDSNPIPPDNYHLPRLSNVNDPIGYTPLGNLAQADPSQLLTPQPAQPNYIAADQVSYASLSGTQPRHLWTGWQPTNFYHRPLLFEDVNLERYGNHFYCQNLASTARFLGTIPTLPYQIGSHGRCHRVYNLQYGRPGDYVPYQIDDFTFDPRGGFWQALATTALVIP